jgi:hypothetical protein
MASIKNLIGRRQFLRDSLITAAKVGAGLAIFEAGRKGLDLLELRDTWAAAEVSNEAFLGKNAGLLDGLELGASFAPEQWSTDRYGAAEAMRGLAFAVNEMSARSGRSAGLRSMCRAACSSRSTRCRRPMQRSGPGTRSPR